MDNFVFLPEDYKNFEDYNNVMVQVFDVKCSVCGFEEITKLRKDAPKTIGNAAQELLDINPEATDDFLDQGLDRNVNDWDAYDNNNADKGIPTFLCETCFEQLKDGEINISNGEITYLDD